MCECPAREECVVAQELLAVVRRLSGEVQLEQEVETDFEAASGPWGRIAHDVHLDREVRQELLEAVLWDVGEAVALLDRDVRGPQAPLVSTRSDERRRETSGRVPRRAPAVSGPSRDEVVERLQQVDDMEVVRDTSAAHGFRLPEPARLRDDGGPLRRRLLSELEAGCRERPEARRTAT